MSNTDYYVYSTLSNDNRYGEVLISGKANVANKNLITPLGVMTRITSAQLEECDSFPVFQLHKENGFITVEKYKEDPDLVASDMTGRDNSAPETPETLVLKDDTIESVEGTDIKHKQKK
jgi:hypothetical protein